MSLVWRFGFADSATFRARRLDVAPLLFLFFLFRMCGSLVSLIQKEITEQFHCGHVKLFCFKSI
jgi:hypothetical protein